jgi:hypothetical protein
MFYQTEIVVAGLQQLVGMRALSVQASTHAQQLLLLADVIV